MAGLTEPAAAAPTSLPAGWTLEEGYNNVWVRGAKQSASRACEVWSESERL